MALFLDFGPCEHSRSLGRSGVCTLTYPAHGTVRRIIGGYLRCNLRFARRIAATPVLLIFVMATLIAQGVFGAHAAGPWYRAIVMPLGNIGFMSVGLALVHHFGITPRHDQLRGRHWQLGIVVAVIALHVVGLLNQHPDAHIAGNWVTQRVLAMTDAVLGPAHALIDASGLSSWGQGELSSIVNNIFLAIAIPFILLLRWWRRAADVVAETRGTL